MKVEFFGQIFENCLHIKYHEHNVRWEPRSMRTDGRTDMTKLVVAFHNFANVPKNPLLFKSNLDYRISCYLNA